MGRETELGQLEHAFDQALQGQRQIVFLSGEPGIGKTTLVNAFFGQLAAQPEQIWLTRGQCVEQYGAGEAYLPILEALGRLGREADGQELVAVLAQYAPTWLAQLPALVMPAEREALQQTLFGATHERMLREMAEALEVLTTRRPVVIALEDLHWSDQSTLELLGYAMRRRGNARLLIVGTFRSTEMGGRDSALKRVVQDLHGRGQGEDLQLELLNEGQIAAYLNTRLGQDKQPVPPVSGLTQLVHTRTGGNPLFMVAMIEHLVREGNIEAVEGQWQLRQDLKVLESGVPETLRQMIGRQVESLTPAERQVLEVASVVGIEFAVAAVAAGDEQAIETVEAQCTGLATNGHFVREVGIEEWPDGTLGGRYGFVHALYQHVLYNRVPQAHRVQLHRRIAARKTAAYGERVGEVAAELAVHCEQGRDYQAAVEYREQAGGNAVRRHAHQEAIEQLSKGLELLDLWPDSAERVRQELRLLMRLGPVLMVAKGYAAPEVEHTYARAREVCQQMGDAPQLFPVLVGLWRFYAVRAKHETTRGLGEQLLALAQSRQDPVFLTEAHRALGASLFWLGEIGLARTHMEHSLASYASQQALAQDSSHGQDARLACLALAAMTLWVLGYPDQALARISEVLALGRASAHPFRLAFALHHSTIVHQLCREEETVKEQADELLRISGEQEFPLWLATGMFQRGWALAAGNQLEEGIAQLEQGLAAYQDTGAELGRPYQLALLAEAYSKVGRTEAGLKLLDEALAAVKKSGEHCWEGELQRLRGEMFLNDERGTRNDERQKKAATMSSVQHSSFSVHRFEEAEACFQRALEIARQQEAKSWELRAALSLARLWQGQGKNDNARQILEESYGWFSEGFDTKDLQEAEALLKSLGSTVKRSFRPESVTAPPIELPLSVLPGKEQLEPPPNPHPLTPTPQSPIPNLFRQEGEYWTLAFRGQTCQVKNTRGMQHVVQLLRYPHQEFFALDLIAGSMVEAQAEQGGPGSADLANDLIRQGGGVQAGLSDAGEVLDEQAKAAYKQRVAELQEELEEAQAFNDIGRAEKVQAEIAFLTQELARAVGLGGRARKAASPSERARVNVTRAIKAAIARIQANHPALGQYLQQTVKTGTVCSYVPDPAHSISWEF